MHGNKTFDVIIVGGSYSGLAAAMAIGRALKKVLIIDNSEPCNIQTPYSHNFITQDGNAPTEITTLAKQQVQRYSTIEFFRGLAVKGMKLANGFEIEAASGEKFRARRLVFATGIKDILPGITGFTECWGISALHCPYCHGYEVRNEATGILGNGEEGYELSQLISNWTKSLTLFTNGRSALSDTQTEKLTERGIGIVETEFESLQHNNGYLESIVFRDGTRTSTKAIYTRNPFKQHCLLPEQLGCDLTDDGYIKVDAFQETTVNGIFACGDNSTRIRTVANAVATGTTAGMMLTRKMILQEFQD